MASHKFKVEINRNPGDSPHFPAQVELTKCLWCHTWHLSMSRDNVADIGIMRACPYCQIEELEKEVAKCTDEIADLVHEKRGVPDGD